MVSMIRMLRLWKYMLEQVVLNLVIGLKCYIECIVGMLKRMDIVLLYLIGKMVKRQVLNLLCFKLTSCEKISWSPLGLQPSSAM